MPGGLTRLAFAVLASALLCACDPQRIEKLEEGVSTEADVRKQFGEPLAVFAEPDGGRMLEYPRQPEGWTNYFITIGPDGRMSALRQVLKPQEFQKIRSGMDKTEVRRLLGRPARTQTFALQRNEVWDWRWKDGAESKRFSVTYDADGRVLETATQLDTRDAGG